MTLFSTQGKCTVRFYTEDFYGICTVPGVAVYIYLLVFGALGISKLLKLYVGFIGGQLHAKPLMLKIFLQKNASLLQPLEFRKKKTKPRLQII